jgi:hypothetical protein
VVDSRVRIQLGLLVCAAMLVGGTALRGARLLRATPDTAVVVRAVEAPGLNKALLVAQDGDAWTVRAVGRDDGRRIRAGQVVEVAGVSLQVVEGAAGGGDEVLRLPWAVLGPARGGHFRIDFGSDPLGEGDGVRDRVVLPETDHGPGWFRLVPAEQDRPFGPDDRGGWLVAERPGLSVRSGSSEVEPDVGERVPVGAAFSVSADAVQLSIAWVSVQRASVLEGSDGRVVGYGESRTSTDFVVRSLGDRAQGAPQLILLDRAGEPLDRVALAESAPTLVHGPRGRLSARGGQILPPTMRDVRLEEAVRSGLAEGWIELGAQSAHVAIPVEEQEPRPDLGWALSRDVVELVDRYDRAARPVGLRLLEGVRSTASTADGAALRFDGSLQAWVPSSRPRSGDPVTFRLVADGPEVLVAAAQPATWRKTGDERWRALPPPRSGRWITWSLDPAAAGSVEVRLEPSVGGEPTESLEFAVAGAPDATWLTSGEVRVGARAYEGWEQPGRDGPARSLWRRIPEDRWSVQGDGPVPRSTPRVAFVRVPLSAATPGWLAMDVAIPGRVLRAWWNGAPLEDPNLPTQGTGGRARLSLKTRSADNLLALQIEVPADAPPQQAGSVRFEADSAGAITALDASVARRRMRDAVRLERRKEKARLKAGAPYVLVERGAGGLVAGTRWRLAPSSSARGESVLWLAQGRGTIRRNDFGALHLGGDGLSWHNGNRLALGAVRPLAKDPAGPPVAGQRVALRGKQRLMTPGEAVHGPEFRLRALPAVEGSLRGDVIVVHGGSVQSVDVDGSPRWHRDSATGDSDGVRIAVQAQGLDVAVAVDRPAALWTAAGVRVPILPAEFDAADVPAAGFTSWPRGARLVVDGSALRLRRPGTFEGLDQPAWAEALGERSTLDPDLQDAARWALRGQLGELGEDTESLAGALLVMNARTGDVLACASEQREGADPTSRLHRPCWQDGGFHPGSTFKVATSSAALSSRDPVVRRMVDGELPAVLKQDGPRGSLKGAKLPGVDGSTARTLRSRLRNFRGKPMPTDTDFEAALRGSMNTWFGYVGLLLHRPTREGWAASGIASQADREAAWPVARIARAAGFSRRLDLGGGEFGTGGSVPSVAATSDAVVAARSVGQGEVTGTPMGVAGLLSIAVSGGEVPAPRISLDRPVARRAVLPAPAAARLRAALTGVVQKGTASRAFADNPHRRRILGKTGSAQRVDRHGLKRTDAWFGAAILPPEGVDGDPIVVVALLPGGGLGGGRAAEAVDQFSRDLIRNRGW